MKLRKRDVPKAACKQTVHAKRRGEMLAITTTRKPPPIFERGPSLRSYLLGLGFQLNNMAAPPLTEAKRLKSALRNVASVGLSVQQSTSSGREGYRTYKSIQFLRKLFLTSQVVQQLYLTARRGGSPFEFSRWKILLNR